MILNMVDRSKGKRKCTHLGSQAPKSNINQGKERNYHKEIFWGVGRVWIVIGSSNFLSNGLHLHLAMSVLAMTTTGLGPATPLFFPPTTSWGPSLMTSASRLTKFGGMIWRSVVMTPALAIPVAGSSTAWAWIGWRRFSGWWGLSVIWRRPTIGLSIMLKKN